MVCGMWCSGLLWHNAHEGNSLIGDALLGKAFPNLDGLVAGSTVDGVSYNLNGHDMALVALNDTVAGCRFRVPNSDSVVARAANMRRRETSGTESSMST